MSKIEVNTVEPQCGTTLTLGASGDTVTLGTGASQSGFGRTGTVNWDTTKKTTGFTAVSGNGYFCDTAASGAFTLTLPSSPSAGDIVGFKDYNGNFATANLTIGRGGQPINGGNSVDVVISTNGASIFLVYVDASQGWVATQDDTSTFSGQSFMVATGGTITTCGDDKIHKFTGPGTFTVCSVASAAANNLVSYLVVAGGGGGGYYSGGGGAGGFRETKSPATPYSASPLDGYGTPGNRITVTATGYPITVGGGGNGGTSPNTAGTNGNPSVFSTITSTAGGGAASGASTCGAGSPGGSGGSSAPGSPSGGGTAGAGNTPPVTPPQGNPSGVSHHEPGVYQLGGGGGGATSVGSSIPSPYPGATSAGPGGAGATTSISGTPTAYAGGGGGGTDNSPRGGGTGGTGGGGNGAPSGGTGTAGTVNTGGGGGGKTPSPAYGGGSGIVIIRYKFQ